MGVSTESHWTPPSDQNLHREIQHHGMVGPGMQAAIILQWLHEATEGLLKLLLWIFLLILQAKAVAILKVIIAEFSWQTQHRLQPCSLYYQFWSQHNCHFMLHGKKIFVLFMPLYSLMYSTVTV